MHQQQCYFELCHFCLDSFPTPRAEVLIEGEEFSQGVSQNDEGKHTEIMDMLKRFR